MTNEGDGIDEFVRALSRVHSGATGALVELSRLLPKVRLVVAVRDLPATGEPIAIPFIKTDDGKTLLTCFSSESTFMRMRHHGEHFGTLPALVVFEQGLAGPFEGIVFDLAGPNRMIIERDVLLSAVHLTRAGDRPEA